MKWLKLAAGSLFFVYSISFFWAIKLYKSDEAAGHALAYFFMLWGATSLAALVVLSAVAAPIFGAYLIKQAIEGYRW